MEYQYASNGKGNAALATGIIGTGLGLLNNGGLGLFGNNAYHNTDGGRYVTKDELDYVQTIAAKDSRIALLESEQNTEVKISDVYARLKGDLLTMERAQADWNATQAVNNAQMSSAIAVNANSIAALQTCCNNITKTVIPNTSICPGWGQVTVTPTGTGTTIG